MTAASKPQKVAIVTGASRGIGPGLVKAFVHAGYAVVATSRSIPTSSEPDVLAVPGDVVEAETARRVVEQAIERFGRIDTLINNAGLFIGKPFTDYTPDDYAAVTAVNLDGFFYVTQRAIRQMADQHGGHIVNVTTSLVEHARSASPSALARRPASSPERSSTSTAAKQPGTEMRTYDKGEVGHVPIPVGTSNVDS
jgi:NAD(P)-dependent dehydrogenase (short-subunit alcohol dehydrogenase family)